MHVYVFTDHNSLQYVFIHKDLNLKQKRWLTLLKDYDVSIIYHPSKSNIVDDALSILSIESITHVKGKENDLTKCIDLHVWGFAL